MCDIADGYGKEGDECVKCPYRVYANPETQKCEPCQPGYGYKWDSGLPECQPCDIGKYRGPDDKWCLSCFGQNTTATVGSTSEDDCCEYLMEFSLNYDLANLANNQEFAHISAKWSHPNNLDFNDLIDLRNSKRHFKDLCSFNFNTLSYAFLLKGNYLKNSANFSTWKSK